MRFIHYTFPYRDNSAGVRVIHRFCHVMRKCGYDAYITDQGNPEWDTPQWNRLLHDPQDIVIYPETVAGNPLGAWKVVRYILYYPRRRGLTYINPIDYALPYHEYVVEDLKAVTTQRHFYTLPLGCIEPGLFYPEEKSNLVAYYVGKGEVDPRFLMVGIKLDDLQRPALANVLRKTKRFFTYDEKTAVTAEAMLCGCECWLIEGGIAVPITEPHAFVMDDDRDERLVSEAVFGIRQHFGLVE